MKTLSVRVTGMALGLMLACAPLRAAPGDIASLLDEYQRQSGIPVAQLDARSVAQLRDGDVVYRKVSVARADGTDNDSTTLRIVGYRVIDRPREALWLAALAYDAGYSRRLTEHLVVNNGDGGASWYQYINMPWPLKNRHWMIETGKDVALASATGNRLWEHYWQLVDNADTRIDALLASESVSGISPADGDRAVLLPLNNGAWVMGELDANRTLVILHATMDMGGIIPDRLVASYTGRQLRSMLSKIEQDADNIWQHYNERYIIYRGDGTIIEPALTAAGKSTTP